MPITGRDRRTLIIGGGILGAMLLLFLLYNLLAGGGGGVEALPTFPSPNLGSPSVVPSPSVRPSVPPIQNFTGRDPFSIPPILASGSASTTGTASPTATVSPTSTPTPSSPTPTVPGGGSSIVINGHTVVLLDTFPRDGTQMAQTEVDGTVYNVAVGDTFAAGQFELRSVSGNCATFLNGDESFRLCATSPK